MSKKISFNVNAYTARLIGRENVATLDGAILELVKNTYDADADICILLYRKKENTLYLMDNGTGMTEEIIENHWMTIGNSSKHTNYVTKNGRIQTGAKGIGRFALDRVSDNSTMFTKNEVDEGVIKWEVNWSDFERCHNLTDVTAEISSINQNLNECIQINEKYEINNLLKKYFLKTGTIFKMTNLRENWNEDLIKDIKTSLKSLIPPELDNEFMIYFFADEDEKLKDALIQSEEIDKYDYKIDFKVSNSGKTVISIHRNEFDFGDKIDQIIQKAGFTAKDKDYFLGEKKVINTTVRELINKEVENLGKFSGTFYFNKIQTSQDDAKKYYYRDIIGRKNYADFFGGIRLYRDNFRVRPYGEKDSSNYDWLLLGKRNSGSAAISHQHNPWKVSPAQITGVVKISRMNVNLPDQANREGIVETPQFKSLKEIIIAIIGKFEEDRQSVGRKLSKLYDLENEVEKHAKEIKVKSQKNKKENKEEETVSASKAQSVIQNREDKIKNLEDENRMLRNLATTGIVSNQYIHETKQAVNNIGLNVSVMLNDVKNNETKDILGYLLETQNYIKTLNSWFDVTLNSIKRDKRKMKFVNIGALVSKYLDLWQNALKNQQIKIEKNISEKMNEIKCFPYEIESILSNLISNSVAAFSGIKNKKIIVNIDNCKDGVIIEYKDTGVGLAPGYKANPDKILNAFETSKRNANGDLIGTGLGMWIIHSIVSEYNGTIDLEKNKELKEGFVIKIIIKSSVKEEQNV